MNINLIIYDVLLETKINIFHFKEPCFNFYKF